MTGPAPGPAPEPAEHRRGVVGPFTARQLGVALLIVAAAAVILFIATRPSGTAPAPGAADPRPTQYAIGDPGSGGMLVGSVAPSLALTGPDGVAVPLRDIDGNVVDLAALRGRPVWINFWASWCPPCQAETPTLRALAAAYAGSGLAVIGISVQESTEADVRAYARKYGLTYPVAADLSGELFHRWRVFGLPTQFFIDRDGVVRAIVNGPVTPESAASNLALIGVNAPAPSGSVAP